MPDLNWENEKMRQDLSKMVKWWLDFGIDGFRVDAVAHLDRDLTFTDSTLESDRYVNQIGQSFQIFQKFMIT